MSSTSTAVAVFDISSSSVGGAHALIEQQKEGTVVSLLVQERRDSALEEELDIKKFVDNTAKALEVVINHVRTADVHHPKLIQVVLGSPWYNSFTRTIRYDKNTLFSCTPRLVESLVDKEIAAFLKESGEDGEPLNKGFKVVEQQISQIKLNGYETADPYGKKVQALEIILTLTLVPDVVVDRFQSIIRKSYGARTITVTTAPYAMFVALRDHGTIDNDCAIIDVGEEVTDIAFVKNGVFSHSHSFPVGTYEFYRTLSESTGSSVEARALVEAYRLKKLSPGSVRTVEKALQHFSKVWQGSLQEVVEEGKYGFQFPAQCYVASDTHFESIFTEIIKNDSYLIHSAGTKEIKTYFISAEHFSHNVRSKSTEIPDPALVVGALFAERLL
ncbi:MAG TPA: hypothetical protein VL576_02070 [Candidatus Paceibacterota bacterium]|nr:hypothetical protein [Candidatus Paceibacterota bacterium]